MPRAICHCILVISTENGIHISHFTGIFFCSSPLRVFVMATTVPHGWVIVTDPVTLIPAIVRQSAHGYFHHILADCFYHFDCFYMELYRGEIMNYPQHKSLGYEMILAHQPTFRQKDQQ